MSTMNLLYEKIEGQLTVCKLLIVLGLIGIVGCDAEKEDQSNSEALEEWQLVWADDFEGDSLQTLDTSKWVYDIGRGDNGWGNGELQYYTDRIRNAHMDGSGHLLIRAYREGYEGAEYTSARVKTKDKMEQRYGKFEARIKAPTGMGIWPAYWLLGSNIDKVGWPQCGEIDVMEVIGEAPNEIHGSLHGPGHSAGEAITETFTLDSGHFDDKFHVFSVEWNADSIVFFVDQTPYQTVKREGIKGEWVYNTPFFMLMNLAIGGTYVGYPEPDEVFPKELVIDYVRVYTRNQKQSEK